MLRVLHCIYDDPGNPWVAGGGAVRVRELYRHLDGRVDATVATGAYPGAAREERIGAVRYRRLGAEAPYGWSRATYAVEANRLLRTAAYDAAVFDFSTYTPIFVPRQRPVGITVHHVSGPTAAGRWGAVGAAAITRLERAMIGRARRLSATSLATRDLLRRIAPEVPVEMVYAGVPDHLFALPREEQDYLLYFGRMDLYQKGLDTLLDAMALLARERPALELRLAGRGKDLDQVKRLAAQRGLEGNVRFLGAVSDAERDALLRGARVQVMPSRFEGFGMVAAEAMAAGVPLVASDAGSLPEVVDAPRGGVLFPAGDAPALAAAVAALLRDPAARARLSVGARASAERFRWRAVAEAHLGFLERIASSGGGAPSSPESI